MVRYRNGQSLYIMLHVIRLILVKNNFCVPKNKWTKSKAEKDEKNQSPNARKLEESMLWPEQERRLRVYCRNGSMRTKMRT